MIRSVVRRLAGAATIAGVLLLVPGLGAAASGRAQPVSDCELAGDVVVDLLDGPEMISDGDEFAAMSGPFPINLPAGAYRVDLQSYDDHTNEAGDDQPAESWFIRGLGEGGDARFESSPIGDLPLAWDTYVETVEVGVDIPSLVQLMAVHAAYPDAGSSNSIQALCVAFTTVTAAAAADASQPSTVESAGGSDATGDSTVAGGGAEVLGAQLEADLPFTGPGDGMGWWGLTLCALGGALLLASREEGVEPAPAAGWSVEG